MMLKMFTSGGTGAVATECNQVEKRAGNESKALDLTLATPVPSSMVLSSG